jgi:hypothetical protein
MSSITQIARFCKKAAIKVFVFLVKCLVVLYEYTLGGVFSLIKDAVISFYRHRLLVRSLRDKHKQLTREVSDNLLKDKDNEKLQLRLQLTDNLIVHNVAVLNRFLWYFLFLLLIVVFLFIRRRSTEVPVSIDVRTSAVAWQVANTSPGDIAYSDWDMVARDTNTFTDNVSLDDDNPAEQELKLVPCAKNSLIEVHQLWLTDKCRMGISLIDSLNANIYYVWKDSLGLPPPTVKWEIGFQDMKISYGGKPANEGCSNHRLITLYKKLKRGPLYALPKQGIRKWRPQRPIRVSDLTFNTAPGLPQSISSIISGKVSLLDIKDRDSVIVLNEGDRLRVNFKEPVDIYLSAEPGYVRIRTQGVATKLECGPEALGPNINRMPRVLKKITDESPYLLTLIGIVVPLLIAMLIRQKKTI